MASVGPLAPFHFHEEQVVRGIAQEIVDNLVRRRGATGHLRVEKEFGSGSHVCFFDREMYKGLAMEMVQESGARLLLHTCIVGASTEGSRITGIVVENKSGRSILPAMVVVDATGDGDVAFRAGARCGMGRAEDGLTQPMTTMFEMANVDVERVWQYIQTHPEDFEWWSPILVSRPSPPGFQQTYFVAQGFLDAMRRATEAGELVLGRDSILLFPALRPGVIHFNSTRVIGVKGTDAWDLTRAEIEGRRQVASLAATMHRYVPGFENAYVLSVGTQIGVRESRRVMGEYVLTQEDVISGRAFSDAVARGFFPIDIHNVRGKGSTAGSGATWEELRGAYDIPYRCLVPEALDQLLVAGRCISTTHEAGASTRSTGCCMATGQAAGTAAAMAARSGIRPRDISVPELQQTLVDQGVILQRNTPAV